MPDVAAKQQKGFALEHFECVRMPNMRFIGKEGEELRDLQVRQELFRTLDAMKEYRSGFDYDILFVHHHGLCIDVEPCHGVWGRFMKADTPVPDGFTYIDFVEKNDAQEEGEAGPPYLSQFVCTTFSGDVAAMHRHEGYDVDGMYDVTRNMMLGKGIIISYPNKYWTAEVFPEGIRKESTAYLFSADFD